MKKIITIIFSLLLLSCGPNIVLQKDSDVSPTPNPFTPIVESSPNNNLSNSPSITPTSNPVAKDPQALKQEIYQEFQSKSIALKNNLPVNFYSIDHDAEINQKTREYNQGQISKTEYYEAQLTYCININVSAEHDMETLGPKYGPKYISELQKLIDRNYQSFSTYYLLLHQ